jgi:protein TonB
MLKYILLSSLLAISLTASAQESKKQKPVVEQPPAAVDPPAPGELEQQPTTPPPPPDIFVYVEQMPAFPGDSLGNYISHNTRYPKEAEKKEIEGRTIVKFIVLKDGSISQPKVIRSAGDESLDAEALRVVSSMPKWIPGKQNGQLVNVYFQIPVTFRLQ